MVVIKMSLTLIILFGCELSLYVVQLSCLAAHSHIWLLMLLAIIVFGAKYPVV